MSSNNLVSYQPQNLQQLELWSERMAKTRFVPQAYQGKPGDILAACLWGWETAELKPMTSLVYIDVIEGRPAYRSEALVAIAMQKGHILDIDEVFTGTPGRDDYAAACTVIKRNGKTLTRRFSVADARKAGLIGKKNWDRWLDRMLIARARAFAVRDAAPMALLSYTAEEVGDFDPDQASAEPARPELKDITPAQDTTEAFAIAAKPEPAKAEEEAFASAIADKPAAPELIMRENVQIFGQDGTQHYGGNVATTALTIYGRCKKRSSDPRAIAVLNLETLKLIAPYLPPGKWRDALVNEIKATQAHVDGLELERRALDDQDGDEVDADGVVRDRRAIDDDGEPGLAAAPE